VSIDDDKRAAAEAALALVRDGMTLGLGTGSTAAWFVRLLGERVRAGLRVRGVPTSSATRALASSLGIELCTLADVPALDLAVDGADEIDPDLRLIKGGGGALLYEKIVASAAARFVVIADATKEVTRLGGVPLPVEVVPFAVPPVERRIRALGGEPALRMAGDRPFVTDAGHHILDVRIDLSDPAATATALRALPGVVEHGLFLDMAHEAITASAGRVAVRRREVSR
jgi:ribose 5-phosphate isomerase A